MEIQQLKAGKIMAAGGDPLSDLPESILIHILSMLSDGKQVVRTSVLSRRWRSLWKSVPLSFSYEFPFSKKMVTALDYLASMHRQLYYLRSCEKIRKFSVVLPWYHKRFAKDVDLWVHFATKVGNVEDFMLCINDHRYEIPQFAYTMNSPMRSLVLWGCQLNPSGSVKWTTLVSLTIKHMKNYLMEGVLEKVLSGCPNLESLELDTVWDKEQSTWHLDIDSLKLRKLVIQDDRRHQNDDFCIEIVAPYVHSLQVLNFSQKLYLQVNSLVTAVLNLNFDQNLDKGCRYMKELLHSVAHVENLEFSPWFIQCMSILALEGWQSPPSSWKSLKLSTPVDFLNFQGIYNFLQSSSDLETLIIDWNNWGPTGALPCYKTEDECLFLHLKTIKFSYMVEPLSEDKFVPSLTKYLLENAVVLEKFVTYIRCGFGVSWDHIEFEQALLRFPRSSPHASIVFSYRRF